jgi:hypothetical protein
MRAHIPAMAVTDVSPAPCVKDSRSVRRTPSGSQQGDPPNLVGDIEWAGIPFQRINAVMKDAGSA